MHHSQKNTQLWLKIDDFERKLRKLFMVEVYLRPGGSVGAGVGFAADG